MGHLKGENKCESAGSLELERIGCSRTEYNIFLKEKNVGN